MFRVFAAYTRWIWMFTWGSTRLHFIWDFAETKWHHIWITHLHSSASEITKQTVFHQHSGKLTRSKKLRGNCWVLDAIWGNLWLWLQTVLLLAQTKWIRERRSDIDYKRDYQAAPLQHTGGEAWYLGTTRHTRFSCFSWPWWTWQISPRCIAVCRQSCQFARTWPCTHYIWSEFLS